MICVTRLNNTRFIVNADLVKFIEETPDTIITLRDGEKLVVRESADEIVTLVMAYMRSIRCFGNC